MIYQRVVPPDRSRWVGPALACVAIAVLGLGAILDDDPAPVATPEADSGRLADQKALRPLAFVVGDWKGVGLERRGSNKGAWRESSSWAWDLSDDSAALSGQFKDGRYLRSARVRPGDEPGRFVLDALMIDESKCTYAGELDDRGRLVLDAPEDRIDPNGGPTRIMIWAAGESRLIVLLEADGRRLGEVGSTRVGVRFAVGDSYPACIVTEGRGTIAVEHDGKTYYVCCSGCKDLFLEDPEAILAEAAARPARGADDHDPR